MKNFWTLLSSSSFHFFPSLSSASIPFPARQVFDTKGCWDFFFSFFLLTSLAVLSALSSSLLPKRPQRSTAEEVMWFKGPVPEWKRLETYALKFVRILCTSYPLYLVNDKFFCMAAWSGCVPRTEEGTKLQFFKRSFFGCWGGPAEGFESQVLKLLLGD